jgi:hypothetical protein
VLGVADQIEMQGDPPFGLRRPRRG